VAVQTKSFFQTGYLSSLLLELSLETQDQLYHSLGALLVERQYVLACQHDVGANLRNLKKVTVGT